MGNTLIKEYLMETANPFDHPSFKVASLSAAISLLPHNYGDSRALFAREKKVRQRTIMVEERNGVLTLIQSRSPGSTENIADHSKRTMRSFVVPHFPLEDVILPAEYDGIRGFGTTALAAKSELIKDRLEMMKSSHDITHEYLRMGAKKGLILDADGTVMFDLYAEFKITKKIVYFDLDNPDANVQESCRNILRETEDNLRGDMLREVVIDISQEFFDKLIKHKSVTEVFSNHSAAVDRLGGDTRKGFKFGGITFNENRSRHVDADGKETRFIDEGKGHSYPIGTSNTFFTAIAPADFNETAGTFGKPYYAKMEARKMGRGYDLHSQSNVLPMCCRPGVLIEVSAEKNPSSKK